MTHKSAFEAVDRTLQDITGLKRPMGGIPTLLCRDFRQILPVVKNGTRANIVNANLKKSYLWDNIRVMKLNTNMRVHLSGDEAAGDFAKLLLTIGDGQIPLVAETDTIVIHTDLGKCVANLEELKSEVYPNLAINGTRPEWLAERAILSPLNTNVKNLNTCLMNEFPGEEKEYRSVDSAIPSRVPQLPGANRDADPHTKAQSGFPHHGPQIYRATQNHKWNSMCRNQAASKPH